MTVTSKRLAGSKLLTRQRAWQLKHPERRAAHEAVKAAIRRGTLIRLPCQECGDPRTDAHHANGYDREHWLDVEFLCRRHHVARHRRKITKGPKP